MQSPAGLCASRDCCCVLVLMHTCPARHTGVHVACIIGTLRCLQSLVCSSKGSDKTCSPGFLWSSGEGRKGRCQQTSAGKAGRAGTTERGQLCRPASGLSWRMSCFPARPGQLGGNWLFAAVHSLALSPGHWSLWPASHLNMYVVDAKVLYVTLQ